MIGRPVRTCSNSGCNQALTAKNRTGRCAKHFYVKICDRPVGQASDNGVNAQERKCADTAQVADATSVPYRVEVLTEDEYAAKYKSVRYASPKILALLAWLDTIALDAIVTVESEKGVPINLLKLQIERTFKNYGRIKTYKLEMRQETKHGHIRIRKTLKETA